MTKAAGPSCSRFSKEEGADVLIVQRSALFV